MALTGFYAIHLLLFLKKNKCDGYDEKPFIPDDPDLNGKTGIGANITSR
jgi:hypothetical protein